MHRTSMGRRLVVVVLVVVVVVVAATLAVAGCGGDSGSSPVPGGSASTVLVGPDLPEITAAAAELGYPRDLLDRGRVNVVVTREGDEPFVVLDHQLRIDGFEPAPAEARRIVIPPNGQRVAIQGVLGEVLDCDVPPPLAATLAIHYTFGDTAEVHTGAIELDDTVTLAEIRARFCTAQRVLAEHDITLGDPTLDGETFRLDVTITRRAGNAELVVDAIQGTVLFGAETPFEQGAPERTLRAGSDQLVLPLTFDVNRCDPHAVAETTKKKGLTLWMAVDGASKQPVDIDISSIDDELEEILDRCRARTGQ